jgi:hypothetical protein
MANQWILPGVVVAVIAVIVGAMIVNQETADNCGGGIGHWHAAYSIWIDGERVSFANPEFNEHSTEDNNKNTHAHGDDGVYHFHPNPSDLCVSFNDAFQHLDAKVDSSSVELGSLHGDMAGTYEGTVQVFEQKWSDRDDEFRRTGLDTLSQDSPGNGDAVVILLGEYTQEEIDAILAQAPQMRGNANYDPHYGT